MTRRGKTWRRILTCALLLGAGPRAEAADDGACPGAIPRAGRAGWVVETLRAGNVRAMRDAVSCAATLRDRRQVVSEVVRVLQRPPDPAQLHQWQMFVEGAVSLIQEAPLDDSAVTDVLIALSDDPEPHFAAILALAHRGRRGIEQLAILMQRHKWAAAGGRATNCRECQPSEATFAAMMRADPNHRLVIEAARERLRGPNPIVDAAPLFDVRPGTANTLVRELTPELVRLREAGPFKEQWAQLLVNHDLTPSIASIPLGYLRRAPEAQGDVGGAIVEKPGGSVQGHFALSDAGGVSVRLAGKEHDLALETVGSGVIYDDRVYLKYYERRGDFVRVLSHDGPQPRWIRLTAVSPPLQAVTWIEDVVERGGGYLLHGYDGYRLRSEPRAGAPVLLRIEERTRHVISHFTGKIAGTWAEAVVVELRGPIGDGCWNDDDLAKVRTERSWTGWIKLVADNGMKGGIGHHDGC